MDILVSLIVVLVTLAIVAMIFTISARRRRALRQRLTAYCEEHHLVFSEDSGRLRRAAVIRGEDWRLETGTEASETSGDSGSPSVTAYTRWESAGAFPALPLLRFGTVPGGAPAQIAAVMPYLSRLAVFDEELGLAPFPLRAPLDARFLLMAPPEAPAGVLGERVERLMESWPQRWSLAVKVGPDGIGIEIPGKRMDCAEDLDAVLALGRALLERFRTDTI